MQSLAQYLTDVLPRVFKVEAPVKVHTKDTKPRPTEFIEVDRGICIHPTVFKQKTTGGEEIEQPAWLITSAHYLHGRFAPYKDGYGQDVDVVEHGMFHSEAAVVRKVAELLLSDRMECEIEGVEYQRQSDTEEALKDGQRACEPEHFVLHGAGNVQG